MQQAETDSGQVVLESTTPRKKLKLKCPRGGGSSCSASDGDGDGINNHNSSNQQAEGHIITSTRDNCEKTKTSPPPPYGSQVYWEERYKTQFAAVHSCSSSQAQGEKETLAYHEWYFTYEELRPLLLPLLLGGREMARHVMQQQQLQEEEDDDNDDGEDQDGTYFDQENDSTGSEQGDKQENELDQNRGSSNESCSDDDDNCSDDDDDDGDSETGVADREAGLASDGPVAILELGCGDVPLGASLALELHHLEQTITGTQAGRIVSQILCTDSSPTVIATMRQQYNCHQRPNTDTQTDDETETATTTATTTNDSASSTAAAAVPSELVVDIGDVPLEFATVDARHLPYVANQFAMVLEKGTLDAVLSDTTHGTRDCIAIVAEAARVLRPGGCLVLVSHLNAHTPNGLSWLEQVVFAGLQKQQQQQQQNGQEFTWEIEVHGHDEVTKQQEEEDGDNNNEDQEQGDNGGKTSPSSASRFPPNSAGPAVYVIHKKAAMTQTGRTDKPTDSDSQTMDEPKETSSSSYSTTTIPVKFFTY